MRMAHGTSRRGAATVLAAALTTVLTTGLAGCAAGDAGPGTPSASSPGSTTSSSSPSSGSTPAPSASSSLRPADPEHAVDPPGPRTGPLLAADILVQAAEPFADEVVDRVKAAKGVTGVARISMAQASLEGRVLNVVAADPGTFRNFTPHQTAESQVVWDRVAGGEIAVDKTLEGVLRPDADGYLRLGAAADAPRIHVGAWAPQIEGAVDIVMNPAWGEAMDIPEGNALLVSTTSTAPDRVVKPIRDVVGPNVSVQRLDVVAREGLDINAPLTAVPVGSLAQAVGIYNYRVVGGRVIPDAGWVRSHVRTRTVPILGSVTCNKHLFPQLTAALQEIVELGLADEIRRDDYAGCYYPRFIAGSSKLSNHAFGLALDLNVSTNGRGIPGDMHPLVVATFKKWGFSWGGDWQWTDPMHFEMNRIVRPG